MGGSGYVAGGVYGADCDVMAVSAEMKNPQVLGHHADSVT